MKIEKIPRSSKEAIELFYHIAQDLPSRDIVKFRNQCIRLAIFHKSKTVKSIHVHKQESISMKDNLLSNLSKAFQTEKSRTCIKCGVTKTFDKLWVRIVDMGVAGFDFEGQRFVCSIKCLKELDESDLSSFTFIQVGCSVS